jgi:thiol-disulfide isomerase/thioredoxin
MILMAVASSAGAQAMTGLSTMSGSSSDMKRPADASGMMAAPSDSMAAASGDMMSDDMSYEALKNAGKLADVKMGSQLRMAKSGGIKVAYTNLMTAEKLAAKNPTVLFFAADWCPSCQADLKDLNANGKRLGTVIVVVVDYDKSADLKAQYGITVQDSFVQIDAMGAKLGIWNGCGVDGILGHIAKAM